MQQQTKLPNSPLVCYDLPFGIASQTAKRHSEYDNTDIFPFKPEILSPEYSASGSQDLFSTQKTDSTVEPFWTQSDSMFSPTTRVQIGMKCGRSIVRPGTQHEALIKDGKKSSRESTLPYNYVSTENIDLPHPKHLFKKKKRKQLESTKHCKKVGDGYSAVHGHIQQLKVKLANRETPRAQRFNKLIFHDEQDIQVPELSPIHNTWLVDQQEEHTLNFDQPGGEIYSSPKAKKQKVMYPSPISKAWDELEGSLHKRWMTGVKFEEE